MFLLLLAHIYSSHTLVIYIYALTFYHGIRAVGSDLPSVCGVCHIFQRSRFSFRRSHFFVTFDQTRCTQLKKFTISNPHPQPSSSESTHITWLRRSNSVTRPTQLRVNTVICSSFSSTWNRFTPHRSSFISHRVTSFSLYCCYFHTYSYLSFFFVLGCFPSGCIIF